MVAVGFVLLIKGADFLVNGASSLAKRFNISDIAIGLTVVAMGTSAPELVVNIISGGTENDGLVFGNIIGSNIFNIFMIFVGIFLFIAILTSRYLTYYQKLFLIVCVLISIVFRTFMIMSTLPLKNRLVPIFISKVRMNTEEVVSVSEVKEPRAQMVTTRGKTRLKQEEVLVAFEFKLNRKALRHYRRKKDAREKTLLVTEPVENL